MAWTLAQAPAPVIVGGSGGSGTRIFALACEAAGLHMGGELNRSHDALPFVPFLDRWIDPTLAAAVGATPDALDAAARAERDALFDACLAAHRAPIAAGAPWGWKNPRSMLVLSYLLERLPTLRFIHIVRDGRDMACSGNQNQLRQHGHVLLGRAWDGKPEPLRAIAFWARANLAAARLGETLGERYLCLRFEDLCDTPEAVLRRLGRFVGAAPEAALGARGEVAPPTTIGRWRTLAKPLRDQLDETAGEALAHFGYAG